MTLTVAWERDLPNGSELLFASDSRVRQGGYWDTCPKVFRLPRGDALLAFAGETLWAYPIAMQTIAGIEAYGPSRRGHYDLRATRGHVMRTVNQMMISGSAATEGWHDITFEFLFGGWCWQKSEFLLWRLFWSIPESRLKHEAIDRSPVGRVKFIGDRGHGESDPSYKVVSQAKSRLSDLLLEKHGKLDLETRLDMEPWTVLVERIRSKEHPTLGGPPQLAKVYRSMNSTVFAIRWPDSRGERTLLGRKLLAYEVIDAPVLDPDHPDQRHYLNGSSN
jgi:hypothetical protein